MADDAAAFRRVLGGGGLATVGVLTGLRLLDGLDGAALSVLAPDIRRSLDI
jgi:hypothetical protein